jgi:hypothetical protein
MARASVPAAIAHLGGGSRDLSYHLVYGAGVAAAYAAFDLF